jgi:hypothetical protein
MNTYEAMEDIRGMLGEGIAAHWTDLMILRALERVQLQMYRKMSMTMGDWFVKKSDALTPNGSGQVSLPSDCAKPIYLEEVTSGYEIPFSVTVRQRGALRQPAAGRGVCQTQGFLLEDVIEINKDGYSNQVYLWYERKCPGLHAGTAAAGGAGSLTLQDAMGASLVDDWYNGLVIEVVGGTGAGTRTTISDYAGSTRVCTLAAGTFGADSVYGIVPIVPEDCHDAWELRTLMQLASKPGAVVNDEHLKWIAGVEKRAWDSFEEWIETRVKNSRYVMRRDEE